MNLLFVHGNFPGQFLEIAPQLTKHCQARTVFLTKSDNPQNVSLPGIQLSRFELHREPAKGVHTYLIPSELAVLNGQAVVRAVDQLIINGFYPDVAIVHGGMGYGLYLKTVYPKIKLISYMEWYFNKNTSQYLYADFGVHQALSAETRNWPIVQELMISDVVVSPTLWQKQQFPALWHDKIQVIFDGINLNQYKPSLTLDRGDLVLKSGSLNGFICVPANAKLMTYATRGMEPLRGFPEFFRAAVVAMQHNPGLHVVIAGNDRAAYSYGPNHSSKSWKIALLEEANELVDLSRLHFPGLVSYGELRNLFWRSDLHCYFTRPYVLSWGLFQAAACGARLLVNQFEGFEEVFQDPNTISVVDLDNQDDINKSVMRCLDLDRTQPLKSSLRNGLDLHTSVRLWINLVRKLCSR